MKQFVQGENDPELFGLIGRWLVDKKVHESLGMAVTSDPGDLWLVKMNKTGEVSGFLSGRMLKNKSMHIRIVHATSGGARTMTALINAAMKIATEKSCKVVWTNERHTSTVLPKLGFSPKPRETGTFCRWECQLQESDNEH